MVQIFFRLAFGLEHVLAYFVLLQVSLDVIMPDGFLFGQWMHIVLYGILLFIQGLGLGLLLVHRFS